MITSVVVFGCLVLAVVVVIIAIYCRQRRRRRRRQQPAPAGAVVPVRYSQVRLGQRNIRNEVGGSVRISFQLPQFDDDDGNVR